MHHRILLGAVVLALLTVVGAVAQTTPPAGPQTEFETSEGARWTTFAGEQSFLTAVTASARVRLSQIGATGQNKPVQLVEIGVPPVGAEAARKRPTAMVVCSQHGNEPSGREACLTLLRDLAFSEDPAITSLLASTTVLVVPSANPDGRDANTRENSKAIDVNRDHVTLESSEARAVAAIVRDWEPDVLLDLHEYGPSMPVIYDDSILWLWPRNLNADRAVHDLAIELGREFLVPAAQEAGYTTDEYGQYEVADNDVTQTAGDGDEGIMRNAMGLRHVLGILVETRVDADVRQSPLEAADAGAVARRRVASHRAVLSGLMRFMRERGPEAARVTAEAAARKTAEGGARNAPVFFGGADNQPATAAQTVTPPPCGYFITNDQLTKLGPRLDLLGIGVARRPDGAIASLAQAAEPILPLLLDERGARSVVAAKPLDADCPPPDAAGVAASPAPAAPAPRTAAARCVQPRTVLVRVPRIRSGRLLSTVVRVGGRRVRVRRGVAPVRVTRRGSTVRVRIEQRVRRAGRTTVRRTTRTLRVCRR